MSNNNLSKSTENFPADSLDWKAIQLDMKNKLPAMSESDALELLAGNGMLIKRPFLIADSVGLLGFKEDLWQAAL